LSDAVLILIIYTDLCRSKCNWL